MSDNPWDERPDNGFLRGSNNELLGRLERGSDGSEWMRQHPDNQYVGRYDPRANMTWDVQGNFVGFGNLLTALLRRR